MPAKACIVVIVVLAQSLDVAATYIGLTYFNGYEANPIARTAIYYCGTLAGPALLKSVVIATVLIAALMTKQADTAKLRLTAWGLSGVFFGLLGAASWIPVIFFGF